MTDSTWTKRSGADYRIGVDVGGTFTDLVVAREGAGVDVLKVPTNRDQPEEGVFAALDAAATQLRDSLEGLLRSTAVFVHGTTIATNTIVQRTGPKVGLLCTDGHRDVLTLRDGFKPERFNLRMDRPQAFVPRYLRLGLSERINYAGEVRRPVDMAQLDRFLDFFDEEDVNTIAVSLMWSGRNPKHELQVRERILERRDDVSISLSSEVLPVIGEYRRTSATVLSAYIKPGLAGYLQALEDRLRAHGLGPRLLVMQANGGAAVVDVIGKRPVIAVGSGPAASPAAALRVGAEFKRKNLIAVDMGGTSFDVAVIKEGHASVAANLNVAGLPLGVDALDIMSVGSGGGSIAWIDSGGALRVGPRSAGSTPGPASYGRGGNEPTVTDADLMLGYLDASNPLGGRMVLHAKLAESALHTIAAPLGTSASEAAVSVFTIVNHNMVDAIRLMSVARGIDPRNYTLVVGGGAGAVHGGRLAQIIGVREVIIPREAGAFCAMGMIAADVRHDYIQLAITKGDELDDAGLHLLNARFQALEATAYEDLAGEGFGPGDITIHRYVDARYRNQFHDLTVAAPLGEIDRLAVVTINQAFNLAHDNAYTYALPNATIDIIHVRLSAFGHVPSPQSECLPDVSDPDPSSARKSERSVYFEALGAFSPTPVYEAAGLRPGMRIDHPAIVERSTTTIVVFPGQALEVKPSGSFSLCEISTAPGAALLHQSRGENVAV